MIIYEKLILFKTSHFCIYQLQIRVQDERTVSSKSDNCNFRIIVDLDDAPVFFGNNPNRVIADSTPLGIVTTVSARDTDLVVWQDFT